jgi:calcineurin-like phosphoesterase family protein
MIRFLQISDIHFTDKDANDDDYSQMKSKFIEDIASCRASMGAIDYVLICGDIAFSGLDNQYKIARDFIKTICDKAQCQSVLLVPGNHDKKWEVYKRLRQSMRDYLLKGKNTKLLLESKVNEPMAIGVLYAPFKQYYKLAEEHLCISDVALKAASFPESDQKGEIPVFAPSDKMFWTQDLGTIKGFHLYVHGSNTSLLSDQDDGESKNLKEGKHLQVVPLQLYNVIAKNDEIHILMLHHPMSEVYNKGNIEADIDSRFKVQLYGHVHKQSSAVDGAIKIYSGALQPEEDESTEYFPVYNVIELDVVKLDGEPQLKVNVFSRKWNGAYFVEYQEETRTGDNALTIGLQKNDAWKETVESLEKKKDIDKEDAFMVDTNINPYAVKNRFLRSGREGIIIKSMYGDQFDKITPNRTKYLLFLRRVEKDGKINELNEQLKKYDK